MNGELRYALYIVKFRNDINSRSQSHCPMFKKKSHYIFELCVRINTLDGNTNINIFLT